MSLIHFYINTVAGGYGNLHFQALIALISNLFTAVAGGVCYCHTCYIYVLTMVV